MHKSITQDRIVAAVEGQLLGDEDVGFCTSCGEDAYGVEPDARGYPCEACGEERVYGASELLLMTVA